MYARSRDEAEAVAGDLTSRYQINAAAFECDITDASAVDGLVDAGPDIDLIVEGAIRRLPGLVG